MWFPRNLTDSEITWEWRDNAGNVRATLRFDRAYHEYVDGDGALRGKDLEYAIAAIEGNQPAPSGAQERMF